MQDKSALELQVRKLIQAEKELKLSTTNLNFKINQMERLNFFTSQLTVERSLSEVYLLYFELLNSIYSLDVAFIFSCTDAEIKPLYLIDSDYIQLKEVDRPGISEKIVFDNFLFTEDRSSAKYNFFLDFLEEFNLVNEVHSCDHSRFLWLQTSLGFGGKSIAFLFSGFGDKFLSPQDVALSDKDRTFLNLSLNNFQRALQNHELYQSTLRWSHQLESTVEERTSELKEAQALLIYNEKMASLGEMASGIAHEINNPLAILNITSTVMQDSLLESAENTEELSEQTQIIKDSTSRISKIVNSLKTFARDAEEDPLVPCDLRDIIEDTYMICHNKFKNLVDFRYEKKATSSMVNVRATQISQVLLNLFNNSFDAIKESKEAWVEVKIIEGNSSTFLVVTDSGDSAALISAEKIFKPFYTTKPVGEGTGLGLSVSKGIMEGHKGSVRLDEESEFTRFILEFPKLAEDC